ncbi:hypothetical protein V2A60_006437 [Cordyceps javanica]|uniref:Alpha/beta hydrolase family domain-containing protein n=1 Tax=Cordyceps javanica TaxID=43265 RepID=A0A545V806_9HYPO|nr:alpha/beta hydrolase family domain-containing protein [Cordyceps javanica]TQW08979.1 alpha/beta hydrolase family domain-containing protein [Cordyceps javanica]
MHRPKAVLIVAGGWHVPVHYRKLMAALESRQIRTICETLPTNNNAVPPNATLYDDINFIKSIVAKEVAVGTHLTVVAHSWGGIVSSAALADFAVPRGSATGGVTDLVFISAFIPKEGESLVSILGGSLPPDIVTQGDILSWRDPIGRFYHDLSPQEALWAESLLVAHGTVVQYTPVDVQKVAWRTTPLTYVLCEDDHALPLDMQDMMVGRVESDGIPVKCFNIPSSHSPFLSMPERVADIVEEVMNQASQ